MGPRVYNNNSWLNVGADYSSYLTISDLSSDFWVRYLSSALDSIKAYQSVAASDNFIFVTFTGNKPLAVNECSIEIRNLNRWRNLFDMTGKVFHT